MARGMRKIRENLANVDLILEVRDARLPLTSINPAFEELFGSDRGLQPKTGKKRLIVYNRRDLAEPGLEQVCNASVIIVHLDLIKQILSAHTKSTFTTFWSTSLVHRLALKYRCEAAIEDCLESVYSL